MKLFKNKIVIITIFMVVLIFIFGTYWALYLRKAHSTFENYYAFRGCTQLLKKTQNYGLCKINSGEIIKIVKFQGKWYLDGDLPWACFDGICFGL